MLVYVSYIHTYTTGIRRSSIIYCNEVYDTYSVVNVCICMYMTSYEQYIALTAAVYACISSSYMHILTPCCEGRMSVYASICKYFYKKYMHIHQAVYERISNSISGSIFVCISNSISCCIFRAHTHGHGAVMVASHSPAPVRCPCPLAARSLWQVCREAAQAQADCHIQLDQVCATEQRQPAATCTCAPLLKCHGNLGWQSFTR